MERLSEKAKLYARNPFLVYLSSIFLAIIFFFIIPFPFKGVIKNVATIIFAGGFIISIIWLFSDVIGKVFRYLKGIVTRGKSRYQKRSSDIVDLLIMLSILGFLGYVFFIKNLYSIHGRFLILEVFMPDIFVRKFFQLWIYNPRTFLPVIWSILGILQLEVTPLLVTIGTRIAGTMCVILSYLIAKKLLSNRILAIVVIVPILLNRYFLEMSASVETVIWGVFFILLGFYYLIIYEEKGEQYSLAMVFLSIICAAGARYELSILFGIPIMLYLFLTQNKTQDYQKRIYFLVALMIIAAIPVIHFYQDADDPHLKGPYNNPFSGVLYRLKNSLLTENQASLSEYSNVSLFYYLSWIASIIILLTRKTIPKEKRYILAFILFFLLYNLFLLSFQIEGLKSPNKYNINFYIPEILIIAFLINNSFTKEPGMIRKISAIAIFVLVIRLATAVSHDYFFVDNLNIGISPHAQEFWKLRQIELEPECGIIKYSTRYPLLDFYKGVTKQDIFLENFSPEPGKCYYYYSGYYAFYEVGDQKTNNETIDYIKSLKEDKECQLETKKIDIIEDQELVLFKLIC